MAGDRGQVMTIPAPVGGWNARDAFPVMDEKDAIVLDNVFPEANLCRVIGGGSLTDSKAVTDGAFQTFAEYFPASGTSYGIVADGDNFHLVTSSGTFTGSPRAHSSTGRWQYVNFNGSIIFVNGLAAPEMYNGTSWSNPSYTGIAAASSLDNIDAYKSRLYFVEKNSLNIWYGGLRSTSGALTQYDISGIVRRGGSIVFAGSLTKDLVSGLADLFTIMTDQGEFIFFSGDNPGATNWQIAGRAYTGSPLGKRAVCQFGADLYVATTEGIVAVSQLLKEAQPVFVTDKIQDAYNKAAAAASSYDGWELHYYPAGHMLILNVPQAYPTDVHQYVMNTFTGAWCRFKGIQASAIRPLRTKLFYAVKNNNTNEIREFGKTATAPADIEIKSAFIPLGDAQTEKQVKRIRPFWHSARGFRHYLECPVDFDAAPLSNMVQTTNNISTPWGSPWGSPWSLGSRSNNTYFGVDCKMGTFFSYHIKTNQITGGEYVPPAGSTLSAVSFLYEVGGIA